MHAIFDIVLDSDIPLPELPEIKTADIDFKVKAGINTNNFPKQSIWLHHWEDSEGTISISCSRQGNYYLLRFPDLVDFIISPSSESIEYFPQPDVAPETTRHLLLDQVIPRVLGHLGRLVLHASAVVFANDIGIAFVGASGNGKSTLASSFHQSGAKLITDDCLLLSEENGQVSGIPNYYGVRLFNDSATAIFGDKLTNSPVAHYTTKTRLLLPDHPGQTQNGNSPIQALFFLEDPVENSDNNEITITPVKGAEVLMSLIKQSFILDVTDKSLIVNQFKSLSNLINNIKVFILQYPRKHELLPEVRAKILDVL